MLYVAFLLLYHINVIAQKEMNQQTLTDSQANVNAGWDIPNATAHCMHYQT